MIYDVTGVTRSLGSSALPTLVETPSIGLVSGGEDLSPHRNIVLFESSIIFHVEVLP